MVAAATRTPFEARHRVFVIERADTMNDEAANALLKTLEEPPPYVVLLLLTDRPAQVLPTIASRCQPVRFDPLPAAALAQRLSRQGVAPEAAHGVRAARARRRRARARAGARRRARAARRAPRRSRARRCTAARSPSAPWRALLDAGARRGRGARERRSRRALAEELEYLPAKEHRRRETEYAERARRAERRARHGRARPRAPARRPVAPRPRLRRRGRRGARRTTPTGASQLREDAAGRDAGRAARGGRAGRGHPRRGWR